MFRRTSLSLKHRFIVHMAHVKIHVFFMRSRGPVLEGSFLNFLAILLPKVSYAFLTLFGK